MRDIFNRGLQEILLAAYLAMWLSRFIFPDSPVDGPSARIFSLAAQLARGLQVPLIPREFVPSPR